MSNIPFFYNQSDEEDATHNKLSKRPGSSYETTNMEPKYKKNPKYARERGEYIYEKDGKRRKPKKGYGDESYHREGTKTKSQNSLLDGKLYTKKQVKKKVKKKAKKHQRNYMIQKEKKRKYKDRFIRLGQLYGELEQNFNILAYQD